MPQVAKKLTNISIGDKAPIQHWDTFVIRITFMHGDADGFETEEVSLSEADEVIELLNFLERCKVRYPHGKGGSADYTDVEGYSRFVEHEGDEDEDIRPITQIEWPYEDGEWCSSFYKYTISYFNKEGQEMQVKLEFDK